MKDPFDESWLKDEIEQCPFRIKPEWIWPGERRDLFYRASYQPALYLLSQALKPKSILEIGFRAGYSAMALLGGSPEATYVGMDNGGGEAESCDDMMVWAKRLVTNHYPEAELIRADTRLTWPNGTNGPFDLAFIDGSHKEPDARDDLLKVWARLSMGGVVVLHDLWHESVRRGVFSQAYQHLSPLASIRTFHLPHGGLILLKKEYDPWTDPTTREFDKL